MYWTGMGTTVGLLSHFGKDFRTVLFRGHQKKYVLQTVNYF